MSNAKYRADQAQPQPQSHPQPQAQPHSQAYDSPAATHRREVGRVMYEAAHDFYLKNGGLEIEAAIALLHTFALEGPEYVRKVMREEIAQPSASSEEPRRPDETQLPEGSEARKLVKQARRAKTVIDAASATKLCKLLVDLVNLRRVITKTGMDTIEQLFLHVTDARGLDTPLPLSEISKRMKSELSLN